LIISAALTLWLAQSNPHAQTQTQFPTPTGHVNDFAGVLPPAMKAKLEATLENLKLRSKVELYVAMVENTGDLDVFDYSSELSRNWNIGYRNSAGKTLLLVVALNSRNSFTQSTRVVQADLPDGVLGEMSQRMRPLLGEGQFADAVDQGVQLFVNSMAQKAGFSLQDIDKRSTNASNDKPSESTAQAKPAEANDPNVTRPRTISDRAEPESSPVATPSAEPTPATTEGAKQTIPEPSAPTPEPTPQAAAMPTPTGEAGSPGSSAPGQTTMSSPATNNDPNLFNNPKKPSEAETFVPAAGTSETADTKPKPTRTPPPRTANKNTAAKNTVAKKPAVSNTVKKQPVSTPADEEEEVELVETKPMAERPAILKQFLETHPTSPARPRAIELLASAYASLGDEALRNGDTAAGVAQLMSLIDESDTSISDKLFAGVIVKIPLNLYLRGEKDAAFTAAQKIETKFGSDPKRLLDLAGFYLRIENGDEVARLGEQAIKIAPDSAEAHRTLALGLHISLHIDEAAAEYKRAFDLDPNAKGARISLADLYRASGKHEEALALYKAQLTADATDKAARTGLVISLFELGRKEEANTALEEALTAEPRNLPLLTGAAYWFVAHEDLDKALTYAQKAVAIEPRYTWAQIALARTLIAMKRPVDAERSIRFARQHGKFPTLNYELANVLASMGLYEEAAEVLRESFTIKDTLIETKLAGRFNATSSNFVDLLAPERKASIYQPTAADSSANAKMLKDLLSLSSTLNVNDGEKIDQAHAETAAREFAGADDGMRVFRQVYGSSRLLRNNVSMKTVLELADDAKKNVESAANSPVATIATQADEYRDLRARSIASGQIPDVASAPRDVIAKILRGRLDDISGWALFNQEKYSQAITHIKRAVATIPEGTPAWRTAVWHLGVVNEQAGHDEEALANYIKSYTTGELDPIRRSTIERLYRKMHGSLDGLEEKFGAAATASAATPASATNVASPTTEGPKSSPSPEKTPAAETSEPRKQETSRANEESVKPPESNPQPSPTPSTAPESAGLSEADLRAVSKRARSTVKIRGQVLDSNKSPIANVVVVIISPSGSVLAATTDGEGRFSFTVAASEKAYRVIPSKDGYSFTPVDRAMSALFNDVLDVDFVGTTARP